MAEEQYYPSYMKGNTEKDYNKAGDKLYDLKQMGAKRTSFAENNQYRVDNLSYPIDLLSANSDTKYNRTGSTEYGNNYVIFYINIDSSSKLLKDQDALRGNNLTVDDYTPADKTRLAGQNITKEQAQTGSAIEGAIAGGAIKGDLKGAAAGAGLNFIGTEVIGTQTASFSKKMKRLQAAIALHTPNNFVARYSANYEEVNTSAFQMAMRGGEDIARAVEGGVKDGNVSDDTTDDMKAIGAAISLNTIGGKDAISAITGLAVNPKKEQVFRGVDFRTWSFDYQFFPRSKQEYQNVQNIIYMFKLHMNPEYKDENNFLYIYPSEFDIVHYNGVDENFNLPRHTSCVLTDLTVNYAPQSQFTAFDNGIPTQINIQMTFKELVQMSKERIMEGY
jgi:hypothetical protein